MALLLAGSAVVLFACAKKDDADSASNETLMTEYSENLDLLMSENGRRSFHFSTPLLEGYMLAREPYREFRKGVKIVTYLDDSLSTVDAVLTANYAISYENRRLWEARGNVVVKKTDGRTLYTEQLFWNQLTHGIYSNVDTRLVQKDGADDFMSSGFESDEDFSFYNFREMDGKTEVELPEPADGDSTVRTPAAPAAPSVATPERKKKRTPPAGRRSEVQRSLRPAGAPDAIKRREPASQDELRAVPATQSMQKLRVRDAEEAPAAPVVPENGAVQSTVPQRADAEKKDR